MATHDELLFLVRNRYPVLDSAKQTRVAVAAMAVLAEPHWKKFGITPLTAVKIAAHRVKRSV
jgi:hypothetical protein